MMEFIKACPVCGSAEFKQFLELRDHFLTKEMFTIVKCGSCGFKFVNPRPGDLQIGDYYQSAEYISHDAEKTDMVSRLYKLARRFSIRRKFKLVQSQGHRDTILDIGCATGEFLQYCQQQGMKVQGMEPNEKARRYAGEVSRVPVVASLDMLAQSGAKYQCITLWHVLEHIHELNRTMETIRNLLEENGLLLVAVPNSRSWDAEYYGEFWAAYDVPRHLYHFDSDSFRTLVEKHGLTLRRILPQPLDAYYVSLLSEKYRKGKNDFLKALLNGIYSNFQAKRGGRGHSSLIYRISVSKTHFKAP